MNRPPENKNATGHGGGFTKANIDKENHIKPDPLVGWFSLSKQANSRQQKSSWKRVRK